MAILPFDIISTGKLQRGPLISIQVWYSKGPAFDPKYRHWLWNGLTVLLITCRHGPHRKHRSSVAVSIVVLSTIGVDRAENTAFQPVNGHAGRCLATALLFHGRCHNTIKHIGFVLINLSWYTYPHIRRKFSIKGNKVTIALYSFCSTLRKKKYEFLSLF
jgi:hypothetical protein